MELAEKRAIITDKKNKTSSLRNELKENKQAIECLNREIKRKSELVESIIAENKILRSERADKNKNKKLTQAKHTEAEAVRKARDQMRTLRMEREENKQNVDKIKKKTRKRNKKQGGKIKKSRNRKKSTSKKNR